jgi:hypothetical protein
MPANKEIDKGLLAFARKIAAIPQGIADHGRFAGSPPSTSPPALPATSEIGSESLVIPISQAGQPDPDVRAAAAIGSVNSGPKQVRHADEIASIIMHTLRTIDNCPARGFVVTVYGSNPWNAMLTIQTAAGPRIDRKLWCSRVRDLGVQLRNEFDVVDLPTGSTTLS